MKNASAAEAKGVGLEGGGCYDTKGEGRLADVVGSDTVGRVVDRLIRLTS